MRIEFARRGRCLRTPGLVGVLFAAGCAAPPNTGTPMRELRIDPACTESEAAQIREAAGTWGNADEALTLQEADGEPNIWCRPEDAHPEDDGCSRSALACTQHGADPVVFLFAGRGSFYDSALHELGHALGAHGHHEDVGVMRVRQSDQSSTITASDLALVFAAGQ